MLIVFDRFSDVSPNDSDFETESELPALPSFISEDILCKLKPEEKKWQEVVNGKHCVIVININVVVVVCFCITGNYKIAAVNSCAVLPCAL